MKSENVILVVLKSQFEQQIFDQFFRSRFEAYAEKIKVQLEVKNTEQDFPEFEICNILNDYKRVLYFNPFCLIREDAPNLFDLVPFDKIGMLNEASFSVKLQKLYDAYKHYEGDSISSKIKNIYYNTDIIVASRIHKQLFKNPYNFKKEELSFDQFLNYKLSKTKDYKIEELSYKLNRIPQGDKKIGKTRLDSFIINYNNAPEDQILPVLQADIKSWDEQRPLYEYKRNIIVSASAGMGDQLCSEPVIRYMINNVYQKDNVLVLTHHPRLFEHLNVPVIHHDQFNWNTASPETLVLHTCPQDDDSETNLSHGYFHPVDFASISMLKKTIPNHDKNIKLGLSIPDFTELMEITQNKVSLTDLVLIHPGKWWPSKTFPITWWNSIIKGLSDANIPVGIIGKYIDEKQGYLDVDVPDNAFDFRDKTSLSNLIALISQAKITITNDSSPLHIAGAFDNWIVLIPTCKHADHILPFRNGTQYYKTKTFYKKYLVDDLKEINGSYKSDSIDAIPEGHNIAEYLPEVDEVIQETIRIYNENTSNQIEQ